MLFELNRMLAAHRLAVIVAIGLLTAAVSTPSRAQSSAPPAIERSIEVQQFQSAIGPGRFLTLDSARVPAHKLFGVGLMFNYQKSPLSLYTINNNDLVKRLDIIDKQFAAELTAAVGLFDRAQVGIAIPMTLFLTGENFDTMGGSIGSLSGAGVGDVRVEGKYLVSQTEIGEDGEDGDVYLAAIGGLTLPTGDDNRFLGDKNFTGRAKIVSEYVFEKKFRVGGTLGVLLRERTQTFAAITAAQLMYAVGAEYWVHPQLSVLGEWFGRNGFSRWVDEAPMEIDLAANVHPTKMFSLVFGGGTGIIRGIGSPTFRGFLGASFHPDFRDEDGDGVYDINDRCPNDLEDRDGYKDSDGCPELDNDGDGIFDSEDKCPTAAEDFDQFEDEDGCPEADNDGDGVPDIKDPCPNAAEDGQGARPSDGCPSSVEDNDGDGVVDARDKCAEEPEDRDGYEDEDGCPEIDNDEDSIPDQFDTCPNQAEDADGFEDEDGCLDPDNDRDGFLDVADKCPSEAETLNLNKDEDGCPDPGAPVVVFEQQTIELRERVAFKDNDLRPAGETLVKLVGLVLKGNPQLTVVRIEVAAGSTAEANARAEAIRALLIAQGINANRLKVAGKVGRADVQFVIENMSNSPKTGAE